MATNTNQGTGSSARGFAAMDKERQREIASKGGQASHQSGNAHEFTPEEARAAGRKGGEVVSQNREHMAEIGAKGGEAVSRDRAHMAQIGAKGGLASGGNRRSAEGSSNRKRGGNSDQHAIAGSRSSGNKGSGQNAQQ